MRHTSSRSFWKAGAGAANYTKITHPRDAQDRACCLQMTFHGTKKKNSGLTSQISDRQRAWPEVSQDKALNIDITTKSTSLFLALGNSKLKAATHRFYFLLWGSSRSFTSQEIKCIRHLNVARSGGNQACPQWAVSVLCGGYK